MLFKLKNKMQVEVQKRIENQRMLNNHLQEVSHTVTQTLVGKFDQQMEQLDE